MRSVLAFFVLSTGLFAGSNTYERGLEFYNQTNFPAAVKVLKEAPQDARTLLLMGQALYMDADFKRASEAFEKAVTIEPGNSVAWTWLGRAYGRRAETSFAMNAMSEAQKAREAFEHAVKLDPKNYEAVADLFEYYTEAPGFLGGGLEKAHNLLPLIAQDNPAEEQFARAKLAEHRKEYATAEDALRRAIDLAPHQVNRVIDLARFFARRNRWDDAEKAFEQAEKVAPNEPKILYAKAETLIQRKQRLDEAQDLLKKYMASPLKPTDPSRHEAAKLLRKAQGL